MTTLTIATKADIRRITRRTRLRRIKRTMAAFFLLFALAACTPAQARQVQKALQKGHAAPMRLCTAHNPYAPCRSNGDNEPIVPPKCSSLDDVQYEGWLSDICT